MSSKSRNQRTFDQRRRVAPAAGFGMVAAGAVAAGLLSAAAAPAARADTEPDPFQDMFGFSPYTANLDTMLNNDFHVLAVLFDGYIDNPSTIPTGALDPPGLEPYDPFQDLLGDLYPNASPAFQHLALEMDTRFHQDSLTFVTVFDHFIDANPPDNDAFADLTQAFGTTGGTYIFELQSLINGGPITDAMADTLIASAGLGPF